MSPSTQRQAPTDVSLDPLALHAQELRHLGVLRRFQRASAAHPGLGHDTDRLRTDLTYRHAFLHRLAAVHDPALARWHATVRDTLAALDVIDRHLNAQVERLSSQPAPLAFATTRPAALPASESAASVVHADFTAPRSTATAPREPAPQRRSGDRRGHPSAGAGEGTTRIATPNPDASARVVSLFRQATGRWRVAALAGVVAGVAVWSAVGLWRADGTGAPAATPPAAAAVAAPDVPASAPVAFRLHGSNTVGEALAPALLEAYLAQKQWGAAQVRQRAPLETALLYPGGPDGAWRQIELHAHGSGTAFTGLAQGKADIGMASRPVKTAEAESLLPVVGDLRLPGSEHVIALDGLAVVVHPSNPVSRLTVQQVAQLFSGAIGNWREVGGPDLPVRVHARDDRSGTWDSFKSMVLERHRVALVADATRYESSSELSDRVAAEPGAVGFIGLPYIRRARAVPVAEVAGASAWAPTVFTVATEDYPLSRRLYLYVPAQTAPDAARDFVEFVQSDAGQQVVRKVGFVAQAITPERVTLPDNVPPAYAELARSAQRASFTFRFRTGAGELDTKGQRDLGRLVAHLARHPDQRVSLVGFADNVGDAGRNLALSRQRAEMVAALLRTQGVVPQRVLGFGADWPVASNDDELGRNRNRRVEVWLEGL